MAPGGKSSAELLGTHAHMVLHDLLSDMVSKSASYKLIGMADDLHDVSSSLNDMRICFIAVTATGYFLLLLFCIFYVCRRNRRGAAPRRRNFDFQNENQREMTATSGGNDELTSVRTDSQGGYMGRNHHHTRLTGERQQPSFMRHGHLNHAQATTRLISSDGDSVVKHQTVPHITTSEATSPAEKREAAQPINVPQLVKGPVELP